MSIWNLTYWQHQEEFLISLSINFHIPSANNETGTRKSSADLYKFFLNLLSTHGIVWKFTFWAHLPMISISLYHKSLKVFKNLNYSQPIPLAYQISWASRKRTHLKWLFKAFVLAKNNFHRTRKILNIFEWNISFIDLRATWEALKTGQLLLETGRNNQYIIVFFRRKWICLRPKILWHSQTWELINLIPGELRVYKQFYVLFFIFTAQLTKKEEAKHASKGESLCAQL